MDGAPSPLPLGERALGDKARDILSRKEEYVDCELARSRAGAVCGVVVVAFVMIERVDELCVLTRSS